MTGPVFDCLVAQSYLTLCNPMDCSPQPPLFMGVLQQEYWSGLLCPPPGDLLNPGIEHRSPTLQVDSLPSEPPGKIWWSSNGRKISEPSAWCQDHSEHKISYDLDSGSLWPNTSPAPGTRKKKDLVWPSQWKEQTQRRQEQSESEDPTAGTTWPCSLEEATPATSAPILAHRDPNSKLREGDRERE